MDHIQEFVHKNKATLYNVFQLDNYGASKQKPTNGDFAVNLSLRINLKK